MNHPITSDGRYFIVRGRLWRMTNPGLSPEVKDQLVKQLMAARSAVRAALRTSNVQALYEARHAVDSAKIALGERGPVWWNDGSPDFNRHLVKNTPYANAR